MSTAKPESVDVHRRSHASLRFGRAPDGRSFLSRQHVPYPFHVTRPFYWEGDPEGACTLYLQSVSGGIFEDDELELTLEAAAGASAHVTTQASTIVHTMTRASARQQVLMRLGEEAFLEYLPDPLVLFPAARLDARVHAVVPRSAIAMVGDAFLAHDPEGRGRPFGSLRNELRVTRPEGEVVCLDRFLVAGENAASVDPALRAHGTLLCLSERLADAAAIGRVQQAVHEVDGLFGGASSLPGAAGVWCRFLAPDAQVLRDGMTAAWSALRVALFGSAPRPRRK